MHDVDPSDLEIETERTRLVLMPVECMEALVAGRRERAEQIMGIEIPSGWPGDDDRWLLTIRIEDVRKHPDWAPWLVRAIVAKDRPVMLGYVNFHGPPNTEGLAEVGYEMFGPHRRRGFAEEAVRALFAWALKKPGVAGFRAAVGPWNEPSLMMVKKLGFSEVGVQWDERDGKELVFELRPER